MILFGPVRRSWGRSPDRGRGQALVEFALIVPIFLLLLFALLDFGRVVFAQQTITQDAREGARAGLVAALDATVNQASYTKIRTAAKQMAAGVTIPDANIRGKAGACTATPGDTAAVGYCFFPDGVVCADPTNPPRVWVEITLAIPLLTPVISNLMGSAITTTAKSITYLPC